jgi:hypothetical protein
MAALTTGILGVASSGFQIAKGISDKSKAKNDLRNLEVPELNNAFEDIQISTLGSDIMNEENQRTTANAVDALQSGGVRSVIGGIPQLVGQNTLANRETRNYLDQQAIRRDYAIAGDNQNIRNMTENRYLGDVQGLNNMIQQSDQNIWSGIRGVVGSAGYMGRSMEYDNFMQDRPKDLTAIYAPPTMGYNF